MNRQQSSASTDTNQSFTRPHQDHQHRPQPNHNQPAGHHGQPAGLLAGEQLRCYLCETPKQEYSLTRAFSEIVCRGCLNYEGPDKIKLLIATARRVKGQHLQQSSPSVNSIYPLRHVASLSHSAPAASSSFKSASSHRTHENSKAASTSPATTKYADVCSLVERIPPASGDVLSADSADCLPSPHRQDVESNPMRASLSKGLRFGATDSLAEQQISAANSSVAATTTSTTTTTTPTTTTSEQVVNANAQHPLESRRTTTTRFIADSSGRPYPMTSIAPLPCRMDLQWPTLPPTVTNSCTHVSQYLAPLRGLTQIEQRTRLQMASRDGVDQRLDEMGESVLSSSQYRQDPSSAKTPMFAHINHGTTSQHQLGHPDYADQTNGVLAPAVNRSKQLPAMLLQANGMPIPVSYMMRANAALCLNRHNPFHYTASFPAQCDGKLPSAFHPPYTQMLTPSANAQMTYMTASSTKQAETNICKSLLAEKKSSADGANDNQHTVRNLRKLLGTDSATISVSRYGERESRKEASPTSVSLLSSREAQQPKKRQDLYNKGHEWQRQHSKNKRVAKPDKNKTAEIDENNNSNDSSLIILVSNSPNCNAEANINLSCASPDEASKQPPVANEESITRMEQHSYDCEAAGGGSNERTLDEVADYRDKNFSREYPLSPLSLPELASQSNKRSSLGIAMNRSDSYSDVRSNTDNSPPVSYRVQDSTAASLTSSQPVAVPSARDPHVTSQQTNGILETSRSQPRHADTAPRGKRIAATFSSRPQTNGNSSGCRQMEAPASSLSAATGANIANVASHLDCPDGAQLDGGHNRQQKDVVSPLKRKAPECSTCKECLVDRHFVQCPSVAAHKFCFACSKQSIEAQQLENKRSKQDLDRVFCPSGERCFLLPERTSWSFMVSRLIEQFCELGR